MRNVHPPYKIVREVYTFCKPLECRPSAGECHLGNRSWRNELISSVFRSSLSGEARFAFSFRYWMNTLPVDGLGRDMMANSLPSHSRRKQASRESALYRMLCPVFRPSSLTTGSSSLVSIIFRISFDGGERRMACLPHAFSAFKIADIKAELAT